MSKRRPSAAMIVAVIALVLGLGGAAIAADLTKPQVKKIAKKVANKQIKKKALLKSQEGSLNVNSAKSADNAATVNGVSVQRVFTQTAPNTGPVDVFNAGGLRMTLACAANGDYTITLVSQVNGSRLLTESNGGQVDLDSGEDFDLTNANFGERDEFTFTTPTGAGVTGDLLTDDPGSPSDTACTVSGVIFAR